MAIGRLLGADDGSDAQTCTVTLKATFDNKNRVPYISLCPLAFFALAVPYPCVSVPKSGELQFRTAAGFCSMAKISTRDKLKSRVDYWAYIASHQSRDAWTFFLVDTVAYGSATYAAIQWFLHGMAATIWFAVPAAIAIPFFKAIYGAYKTWKAVNKLRFADDNRSERRTQLGNPSAMVDLLAIEPSDRQFRLGFKRETLGADVVLRSVRVDDALALAEQDWPCATQKYHREQVKKVIRANRDFCLAFLTLAFERAKNKALFFNSKKWCLCSELDPSSDRAVKISEGYYFDSYCTNEASTAVLIDKFNYERSGLPLLPVDSTDNSLSQLLDLEAAAVNNHVGVSTLAITEDRRLVIWQQGEVNIQSPQQIVATGSGSGDYADLDMKSLRRSVIAGMERELREEALKNQGKLPGPVIAETTILGFFRWISRGGKPEFFGITRLDEPYSAVCPDEFEVSAIGKATAKQAKLRHQFHLPDLEALPLAIASIRGYEKQGHSLSLPLKIILRRLEELLVSNPDAVRRMLFGNESAET
jgi:hypothetical protein